MILSKTCDYALRAAFFIASRQDRKFVPIREMSEKLNISFHFLTKILQVLNQKDITISFKGPNGGIALARPAELIYLNEIVEAVDGNKIYQECLLGLDNCGDQNPCPLHNQWAGIRQQLQAIFDQTSLFEVAEKIEKNGFRITDLIAKNFDQKAIND